MAWTPAKNKTDAEFVKEARHHNSKGLNDMKMSRQGRWLEAALDRLERRCEDSDEV